MMGEIMTEDPYLSGRWVPCNCCEDFWCTAHEKHAHECPCPPVGGDDDE